MPRLPLSTASAVDPAASEIHRLRQENDSLKREWQTCEILLSESQSDNERKHFTIESLKRYIRDLEDLLGSTLGSSWKVDNDIPSAESTTSSNPTFNASTPLPKPIGHLRHSTSVTFSSKRLSCLITRRTSAMNRSGMAKVKEADPELDDTPTGALKRLTGSTSVNSIQPATTTSRGKMLSEGGLARQSESSEVKDAQPSSFEETNCGSPSLSLPAAVLPQASSDTAIIRPHCQQDNQLNYDEGDGSRSNIAAMLKTISGQVENLARTSREKQSMSNVYAADVVEELKRMQQRSMQREAALKVMVEEARRLAVVRE